MGKFKLKKKKKKSFFSDLKFENLKNINKQLAHKYRQRQQQRAREELQALIKKEKSKKKDT